MARRVDVPREKVFVGLSVVLGVPIVDELSKVPVDMTGWNLQLTVRDTPKGTVRLTKTSPVGITTDAWRSVPNAMAKIQLEGDDTVDGQGEIIFSGKKCFALKRDDPQAEVLLAHGDIWFEVSAER